jgi:hypothetical protein
MVDQDKEEIYEELFISLTHRVFVLEEDGDERDNYVRHFEGPVLLIRGEREEETEIGRAELIYYDGSRAIDCGLDIVDIADSFRQAEYEYAQSMYTEGMLNQELIGYEMSNDLLAVRSVSILPEYRSRDYGLRIVRKIAETVGYHCGAVVIGSNVLAEAGIEPEGVSDNPNALELQPTKNPTIYCIKRFDG